MRYLIDGYNVTMADPATRALEAGEQREALVRRLAGRSGVFPGPGEILVVFDGRDDGAGLRRVGRVRVIFSGEKSADDVLVDEVSRSVGDVTLVTSDRQLAARACAARNGGLDVLDGARAFESAAADRRGGSAKRRYPASTVGLPKGANRITEELKGIWLDDTKE